VAVDALGFWMVGYEKCGPALLTVQIYTPANVKTDCSNRCKTAENEIGDITLETV